jgi:hypothetical protein
MTFLTEHFYEILTALIAAAGTITALTETEKDDKIVNIIARILQAIFIGKSRGTRKAQK